VLTRSYAAPQGPIESALATLWSDLLGLERVGRHDHFFELGGHSLLVVQMSIRLREALDIDISLRTLFENPVLEQLAEFIVDSQLATFSPEEIARIEREIDVLSDDQLASALSGSTDDE
jgi:acyl carrier protein